MLEKKSENDLFYEAIWPNGAPKKNIACPACGRKNRLDVGRASLLINKCRCGDCGAWMFRPKTEPIRNLAPKSYQHPLDYSSLRALKRIPGLPKILKMFLNEIGEKPMRYQLLASSVLCGTDQFPELYTHLESAAKSLDLNTIPSLFLSQSPVSNASTFGAENPVIVVHSALLDILDEEGIRTVLGHELGHVHCEHSTYKLLASLLLLGGSKLRGWPSLITAPLHMGLQKWSRCAELTADRAGLLASRSLKASINVLLRMAGGYTYGVSKRTKMKVGPFVRQARELQAAENDNWMDSIVADVVTANRSHPFLAWRLLKLLEWVEEGSFLELILADTPKDVPAR